MTVSADGRVQWNGYAHVASRGPRTGRIAPPAIRAIERKLAAIEFHTYNASGRKPSKPTCITETTPTAHSVQCSFSESTSACTSEAIITVRRGDRTHRVAHVACGNRDAEQLTQLEDLIDEVSGTRDWR